MYYLSYYVSIIVGIVEGLTEFLPVSSTGHMILTQALLGIPEDDELMKVFEIVIQLGAILAVVVLYWERIVNLLKFKVPSFKSPSRELNVLHIALGILPAGLIGVMFGKKIQSVMFSPKVVILSLIVGGILLIVAEKKATPKPAQTLDQITYKQSFVIGLYQILSVVLPGFSRSGATIAGGMLSGVSRGAAADFTFILAIPLMFAATALSLAKSYKLLLQPEVIGPFAVGFIVSFLVAWLAVKSFIKYVQKVPLTYFAWYRFVIATLFIIAMLAGVEFGGK